MVEIVPIVLPTILGHSTTPAFLPPAFRANPPDVYLDFTTNKAWKKNGNVTTQATSLVNVGRASPATQADSNGNYSQFANNQLAWSNLGASIWEARINGIRNNTMQGAIVQADDVELLINGNFAAQGAGWTVRQSTGSIVFSVGSVSTAGNGITNDVYIAQQITGLVVGRNYVVSVTGGTLTASINILVGSAAGDGSVLGSFGISVNGSNSTTPDRVAFTATATSHWVTFARTSTSTFIFTGFSVQDGERCQNGTFPFSPVSASQNTVQNGWQWSNNASTGTVVYNSGPHNVTFTPDGTAATFIDVPVPTVAGFSYIITADVTGGQCNVQAGTAAGTATLLSASSAIGTGQKFQFTATGTTSHVSFARISVATVTVANVSVQSAGALPTNWSASLTAGSGAFSVAGLGVEQGVAYIDFQSLFTAAATSTVQFDSGSIISALYGQTWTGSFFAEVSGGSTTGITSFLQLISENTSGGTFIAATTAAFTPFVGTGQLGANRISASRTLSNSTAGAVINAFRVISSGAANVTVRLGWPQLENNLGLTVGVASAVVVAGGTGGTTGTAVYQVGGGTLSTTAATLNVTVSGGAITAINSVAASGGYTVFPPSPASLTYVSGTGSGVTGATVTLTPINIATAAAASNPIPTSSAAVTRSAELDTLVLAGLPAFAINFSGWVKASPQTPTGYEQLQSMLEIWNSTTNRVAIRRNSFTGVPVTGGGGDYAGLTFTATGSPVWAQNASGKAALAVTPSPANSGFVFNASTPNDAAVAITLIPNAVNIGCTNNGSAVFVANANLQAVAIWFNQRVPDATLVATTT